MRHRTTAPAAVSPAAPWLPLCCLLLALWAVHAVGIRQLAFTGDEVRYVAYGLGLFHGQGFHPSDAVWQDMLRDAAIVSPLTGSPAGHEGRLIHSVVYPLLGSPLIHWFGLAGARWLSFAVGAAGLVVLFFALRRRFDHATSLTTLAAVAFACPVLLYLRLFFAEILLFACNCLVAAFFLSGRRREPRLAVAAGLGLCLLPFVHVKLSLEAAVGFLVLFFSVRPRLSPARQAGLLAMAGGLFLLYLGYNHLLFGAAIGGGNPAFPVSPLAIPDRVLVNLFDMRHGLLPNAPHLLFGLIGLGLLWTDRDPEARILVGLFAAYFFTMLWANGSEAHAARNWMAAMPFVALGLARWLSRVSRCNKVLALPFFLLSFCLLLVLFQWPDAFLDSRNHSVPFDRLFALLPWFHFGYVLPYDFLDHLGAALNASLPLGLAALAVVGLYAAGQVLADRVRRALPGAALQVLALGVIVFFTLVEKVEETAVALVGDGNAFYVNLALPRPERLAFVRLDNPDAVMKPYGFFLVVLKNGTALTAFRTRASSVVPLPPFTPAGAVMIAETPPAPDRRWLDTAAGATVYRRLLSLPGLGD